MDLMNRRIILLAVDQCFYMIAVNHISRHATGNVGRSAQRFGTRNMIIPGDFIHAKRGIGTIVNGIIV